MTVSHSQDTLTISKDVKQSYLHVHVNFIIMYMYMYMYMHVQCINYTCIGQCPERLSD